MTAGVQSDPTAPRWARALRTEIGAAVATPVARLLLSGSVAMAVVTCTANLVVLDSLAGDAPTRVALHSATVPALVFAMIAGAYAASTDRRHGFIDQRLLIDPSRLRWLGAKALAQSAVGLGYGVLGAATAIATSTVVFAARGEVFDTTSVLVARSLAGVVVAAPIFALLGAAIGSLTANTSAVLAGLMVWVLVIEPPTVLGLPEMGRWLPAAAGLALTYSPNEALLNQGGGGLVLLTYGAAGFLLAARRLRQSDL